MPKAQMEKLHNIMLELAPQGELVTSVAIGNAGRKAGMLVTQVFLSLECLISEGRVERVHVGPCQWAYKVCPKPFYIGTIHHAAVYGSSPYLSPYGDHSRKTNSSNKDSITNHRDF